MASVETELYMLGQRIKEEAQESHQAGWDQALEYAERVLRQLREDCSISQEEGVVAAIERLAQRPVI